MPTERTLSGTVVAFDADAGLGEVRSDDGHTWSFHCTCIADGSRTVAVGSGVHFRVVAWHLGRWEAVDLTVVRPASASGSTGGSSPAHGCPVCEAPVPGAAGDLAECPVCGWQDDPVQAADPDAAGRNALTLSAARAEWRRRHQG